MLTRVLPWRSAQVQQAHFRMSREGAPQSFAEFLGHISYSVPQGEQELISIIRDVVAKFSNLEAEFLHAEDNTRELSSVMVATTPWGWFATLGDRGPDEESFFLAFREHGRDRLGMDCFVDLALRRSAIKRWRTGCPFGDWTAWLAREIANAKHRASQE